MEKKTFLWIVGLFFSFQLFAEVSCINPRLKSPLFYRFRREFRTDKGSRRLVMGILLSPFAITNDDKISELMHEIQNYKRPGKRRWPFKSTREMRHLLKDLRLPITKENLEKLSRINLNSFCFGNQYMAWESILDRLSKNPIFSLEEKTEEEKIEKKKEEKAFTVIDGFLHFQEKKLPDPKVEQKIPVSELEFEDWEVPCD